MRIVAALPRDRIRPGVLGIVGNSRFAPARCRGEADNAAASAHGNPAEDPTRAYGDHPYGLYMVTAVERDKGERYGPAFLRLDPLDVPPENTEAAIAERNGRAGLGIHGGPLLPDGTLRATHGCLRVDNAVDADIADIAEAALAAGQHVIYECLPLREG